LIVRLIHTPTPDPLSGRLEPTGVRSRTHEAAAHKKPGVCHRGELCGYCQERHPPTPAGLHHPGKDRRADDITQECEQEAGRRRAIRHLRRRRQPAQNGISKQRETSPIRYSRIPTPAVSSGAITERH
jgi:hypothetical protein